MRCLLVGFAAVWATLGGLEAESFLLPSQWTVELPANANSGEKFAASELKRYLAALPGGGPSGPYHISLSSRGLDLPDPQPDARAGDDVYRIIVRPDGAELTGVNERAVIYAAYDFLEQLGWRWFMPGALGEVPATKRELTVGTRIERPAFFVREICSSATESWTQEEMVAWEIRNRLNRDFNLRRDPIWAERGGFPVWQWIAHNYKFIFPDEKTLKSHPDWLALYKGKRIPLGQEQGNICTTNPEVIAYFVKFIRSWFDAHPEGSVFPLSPPDGAIRWCEDEACLALGGRNFTPGPEGSMSRRQIHFVRAIAEEVGQTHPDRKILLLAYQNFVDPVPDEKLPANVIVQVVNYGAFGQPMTEPINQKQAERFRGWARITDPASGSPGIWDYALLQVDALSGSRLSPIPVARALHENMRFIHELGGRIFFVQAGPIQESNPLVFYAVARWAWNPALTLSELRKNFCDRFYGAAAKPMNAYWALLEQAAKDAEWNPAVWPGITIPDTRVFTPEVLTAATQYLDAAENAASTETEKARVALIRRSLDYVVTTAAQAKPWRVGRGETHYSINQDGGNEALQQVKGLTAELKNSTDPDGSLQRLIFRLRPREAGLESLKNSALQVTVIPELGGRLIRMIDKSTGWNFFDEPGEDLILDNPGAAYIHYGGYEEYAGTTFAAPGWETPFRYGRERDGLRLVGKIGEVELRRQITLDGDKPAFAIRSEISSPTGKTALRSHPVFHLPDAINDLVLVWKNQSGKWSHQSIEEGTPSSVAGFWGVYSPQLQTLLLHHFNPDETTPHLHLDREKKTFNLELMTHPEGTVIAQDFRLLHGTFDTLFNDLTAEQSAPKNP